MNKPETPSALFQRRLNVLSPSYYHHYDEPLTAVRAKGVTVTGEDNIHAYHHSPHGERAVCRVCGTTLYWKLQGRGLAFLALGILDDRTGKRLTEEIFVDHRPDWMPPIAGAAQHTEAEMKAQLDAFLAQETQS